jgi:hypothetical protein
MLGQWPLWSAYLSLAGYNYLGQTRIVRLVNSPGLVVTIPSLLRSVKCPLLVAEVLILVGSTPIKSQMSTASIPSLCFGSESPSENRIPQSVERSIIIFSILMGCHTPCSDTHTHEYTNIRLFGFLVYNEVPKVPGWLLLWGDRSPIVTYNIPILSPLSDIISIYYIHIFPLIQLTILHVSIIFPILSHYPYIVPLSIYIYIDR